MPTDVVANRSWLADLGYGLAALALVAAASILGQIATTPNLAPWYASLAKPPFNPPNWVFAPVWSALYVLMAVALWRVLRLPRSPARHTALTLFFVQLVLNIAWSWMFFAAHSPLLGLINIVPQFIAVLAATIACGRADRIAGWCLTPLVGWVGFATLLNASIWWLNG